MLQAITFLPNVPMPKMARLICLLRGVIRNSVMGQWNRPRHSCHFSTARQFIPRPRLCIERYYFTTTEKPLSNLSPAALRLTKTSALDWPTLRRPLLALCRA